MSAIAEPVIDAVAGDRLARRNALMLAATQALAGGNNTVLVATAGIVGTMLAPDRGLATLPISIFVLGLWMGALPIGLAHGVRLARPVAAGTVVTKSDLSALPSGEAARLRTELEATEEFVHPTGSSAI